MSITTTYYYCYIQLGASAPLNEVTTEFVSYSHGHSLVELRRDGTSVLPPLQINNCRHIIVISLEELWHSDEHGSRRNPQQHYYQQLSLPPRPTDA